MLGRHDEGDALRSRSLALREAIVRAEPGSKYDRERLCFTYFNMAMPLESTKPDLALEFDAKAKEQREILLRAEPDDVESRVDLAGIYGHIARVLSFKKDRAGQYAALAKARTLYEDALRRLPELEQARDDLSKVLVHLGRLLVEDGRDAEARPALRRASELLERLAEENPQFVGFANELTMLSFNEADILARLGRVDEADAVLDRERARREARLKAAPGPAAKVLTARVAREMEQSTFPGLRRSPRSRNGGAASSSSWRRSCATSRRTGSPASTWPSSSAGRGRAGGRGAPRRGRAELREGGRTLRGARARTRRTFITAAASSTRPPTGPRCSRGSGAMPRRSPRSRRWSP